MNLYKEMMRRYLIVGSIVLVLTVIISCVFGFMKADVNISELSAAINLMPIMPAFDYAAGLLFGFIGFSFLNRRASSDFYHSIPVSRAKLFLAITLAAMTWIGATVIISILATAGAYLVVGMPFVGLYVPMNILFHIVASMLVFAATTIGCSLTGTFVTNGIVTGLILFLPRFLLFIAARQLVDQSGLLKWTDLTWFLNPSTNIATGMIVLLSRSILIDTIVSLPNILYSLVLAIIELLIGCTLFVHRPSELAEHCSESRKIQTVFSCMVALPFLALIPIMTANGRQIFNWRMVTIVLMSFALFLIYQLVALRPIKRINSTLPYFFCSVAFVVLMMLCVKGGANTILGPRGTPLASDKWNAASFGSPVGGTMKSVTFLETNNHRDIDSYQAYLIRKIRFDDEEVKQHIACDLETSVFCQREYGGQYGTYDPYEYIYSLGSIDSITIRKTNGGVIKRTIGIRDFDRLNEIRRKNPEFEYAIHAFPPVDSIKIVTNFNGLSKADAEKLRSCYFAECVEKDLIPYRLYTPAKIKDYNNWRNGYSCGDEQIFASFMVAGNIGMHRYVDHYSIDGRTPKTASLYMMLLNKMLPAHNADSMDRAYRLISASTGGNDTFSASLTFINAKLFGDDWEAGQAYFLLYNDSYSNKNIEGNDYYRDMQEYAKQMFTIMKRGIPTNDSTRFSIGFSWNASTDSSFTGSYCPTENGGRIEQMQYLGFSEEDEAEILRITKQWMQRTRGEWTGVEETIE